MNLQHMHREARTAFPQQQTRAELLAHLDGWR
jgi:hypothetical protein